MNDLTKSLPKLAFVLAILGSVAWLTAEGVTTANDAMGFLSLVIGATAVAGTIVLAGPTSNANLIPHVVVLIAILGFVTAMGLLGIFTGTEIVAVLGVMIGGGSVGYGSVNPTPVPPTPVETPRPQPVPSITVPPVAP